jgi:hypothetical protein
MSNKTEVDGYLPKFPHTAQLRLQGHKANSGAMHTYRRLICFRSKIQRGDTGRLRGPRYCASQADTVHLKFRRLRSNAEAAVVTRLERTLVTAHIGHARIQSSADAHRYPRAQRQGQWCVFSRRRRIHATGRGCPVQVRPRGTVRQLRVQAEVRNGVVLCTPCHWRVAQQSCRACPQRTPNHHGRSRTRRM